MLKETDDKFHSHKHTDTCDMYASMCMLVCVMQADYIGAEVRE